MIQYKDEHTRLVGSQELGRANLWGRPTARYASKETSGPSGHQPGGEPAFSSLPAQMHTWKETKALYRLLDEPDVTFAALMQPHLQQTREQATSSPVVLLVQDTTAIDLSHRRKISGVGQIGNERGRGFFVQTVLAVRPQTREVLGCMAQEPFVRIPAPKARTALSTTQARGARKRCLDTPGASHWHP